MSAPPAVKLYERKTTAVERFLSRAPFAIVTMVARIKGSVTEELLRSAVLKVQQRHPHLRVRLRDDGHGDLWLTSQGAGDIPVEVVERESDEHWMAVCEEASQQPFDFEARPAIRFILVQSADLSELIILCHHLICDGLSLAYLARDVMVHLGDPAREVDILPDAAPVDKNTIPGEVSINPVVRYFINRINKQWAKARACFDQEDYIALNEAYWAVYHHRMRTIELSEAQTTALVERCRAEQVTVNTALTAAIVGAQVAVLGDQPLLDTTAVAASLRDRLQPPVGEAMGFYASAATLKFKYDGRREFWDNARQLHQKLKQLYDNKTLFAQHYLWSQLDPAMMEAMHYKKLGGLVPPHSPRYQKLHAYSQQDDVVLSVLKRNKSDSLDSLMMGTAVTNLTRMDFPATYGPLALDRLIMNPGGGFPLVNVKLVLGVVTCSGKLSLVLEYAEESIDSASVERVRAQMMAWLLGEKA